MRMTLHVCVYRLPFPQCAIHYTFQTSVQNKTLHSGIPSNITQAHPLFTHICDQKIIIKKKKKQQADHSDWYNPTDLLHLCLHYTVTQVMTPDVFTEGQGGEQGRGIWWPPEREC